jgi:hypothetical protein
MTRPVRSVCCSLDTHEDHPLLAEAVSTDTLRSVQYPGQGLVTARPGPDYLVTA